MSSQEEDGVLREQGPSFVPVTKADFYEDIPLLGQPGFEGGIFKSDHLLENTMEIETKEITSAPSTEVKDAEVRSGTQSQRRPCSNPDCPHAGATHVHEAAG